MADAVQTFKDAGLAKQRLEAEGRWRSAARARSCARERRSGAGAHGPGAGRGGRRPGRRAGAAVRGQPDLPSASGFQPRLRETARGLQPGHRQGAGDQARHRRQRRRHPRRRPRGLERGGTIWPGEPNARPRTWRRPPRRSRRSPPRCASPPRAPARRATRRPAPRARPCAQRGGPRGGGGHGRHRELGPPDHPDHRCDRRDRLPDQSSRPERRRGGPPVRATPAAASRWSPRRCGALAQRSAAAAKEIKAADHGLHRSGGDRGRPRAADGRSPAADRGPGVAPETASSRTSPARPRSSPSPCSRSTPRSTTWTAPPSRTRRWSREASAASVALATEAETLARLVGQFRVDSDETPRRARAA